MTRAWAAGAACFGALGVGLAACGGASAPAPAAPLSNAAPGGAAPAAAATPAASLSGRIEIAPALASRAQPGGTIFVMVRPAGGSALLAVDKLAWAPGVTFLLDEADQLGAASGALAGRVTIAARYDQDSDAITKQPGDLTGSIAADVPAQGLVLLLDSVLP